MHWMQAAILHLLLVIRLLANLPEKVYGHFGKRNRLVVSRISLSSVRWWPEYADTSSRRKLFLEHQSTLAHGDIKKSFCVYTDASH